MSSFGGRLRDSMLIAGLSKSAIAAQCGVTRQTVNKWLASDTASLSAVHVAKLSRILQVRLFWLITGEGTPELIVGTDGDIAKAARLLPRMTPEQVQLWLRIGIVIARQNPDEP